MNKVLSPELNKAISGILATRIARGDADSVPHLIRHHQIHPIDAPASPSLVGRMVCQEIPDLILVRAVVNDGRRPLTSRRRARKVSLWSVLASTIFNAIGDAVLFREKRGQPFWAAVHGGSIKSRQSYFSRVRSDAVFAAAMYDPKGMEVLSLCVAAELPALNLTHAKVCQLVGLGPLEDYRFSEAQKLVQRARLARMLMDMKDRSAGCMVLSFQDFKEKFEK